jgi:hypothetical protein
MVNPGMAGFHGGCPCPGAGYGSRNSESASSVLAKNRGGGGSPRPLDIDEHELFYLSCGFHAHAQKNCYPAARASAAPAVLPVAHSQPKASFGGGLSRRRFSYSSAVPDTAQLEGARERGSYAEGGLCTSFAAAGLLLFSPSLSSTHPCASFERPTQVTART